MRDVSTMAVATVGCLKCFPKAVNVIPGRVEFSVDWRAPDDELLKRGDKRIREIVAEACRRRRVGIGNRGNRINRCLPVG